MSDYDMESIDKDARYGDSEDYPHLVTSDRIDLLRKQARLNDEYTFWLAELRRRAIPVNEKGDENDDQ